MQVWKSGLFIFGLMVLVSCGKDYVSDLNFDCTDISYSGNIASLVEVSCNDAGCHTTGASIGDFTTHSGLSGVGKGELRRHVLNNSADMPPAGSTQLTDEEKATLQCWIDNDMPND